MRPDEEDREAIGAMLHAIEQISNRVGGFGDLGDADEFTQWGVFYGLIRLGEAASAVSEHVRRAHPELPWRQLKDVRNRIAHGYDLPSLPIVWNVVRHELPRLEAQLRQILANFTLPPTGADPH